MQIMACACSLFLFLVVDSSKAPTTLPSDVTHYVVPDVDTVLKYLEILELNQLSGVLFMQTVTHAVWNLKKITIFTYEKLNA